MVNVLATFAQFERRLIGQRTKEAIAERRRKNPKWGRPSKVPASVERRIKRERRAGKNPRRNCRWAEPGSAWRRLEAGGKWWPETVRGVLSRQS